MRTIVSVMISEGVMSMECIVYEQAFVMGE
jgi:hypothetical protein